MRKQEKRVVENMVLPGEPTDGSGRVCIHLFVRDPSGPFVEPHVLHPVLGEDGEPLKGALQALPTRGRLACDRRRLVAPVTRNGVTTVTHRTGEPRAVSCHKCRGTAEWQEMMDRENKAREGSK